MLRIYPESGERVISLSVFSEKEPIAFFTNLALSEIPWKLDPSIKKSTDALHQQIWSADQAVRSRFICLKSGNEHVPTLH